MVRYPQTCCTKTSWRNSKLCICHLPSVGITRSLNEMARGKDTNYLNNFFHFFFLAGVVEFTYIKYLIMMGLHYILSSSWLYYQVKCHNYFLIGELAENKHSSVSLRAALLVWGSQPFRAHYLIIHSTDMTWFLILPNLSVKCFCYNLSIRD